MIYLLFGAVAIICFSIMLAAYLFDTYDARQRARRDEVAMRHLLARRRRANDDDEEDGGSP